MMCVLAPSWQIRLKCVGLCKQEPVGSPEEQVPKGNRVVSGPSLAPLLSSSSSVSAGLLPGLITGLWRNDPVIKSDQQCFSNRVWACCLNWWFPHLAPCGAPASEWPHLPRLKAVMIKGKHVFPSTQQKITRVEGSSRSIHKEPLKFPFITSAKEVLSPFVFPSDFSTEFLVCSTQQMDFSWTQVLLVARWQC